MPAPDLIALFTGPLEQLGAPYMITGATAAILYGQPRLTNDLDVVIELRSEEIARLRAGFPETEFYVPPAEIIEIELAGRSAPISTSSISIRATKPTSIPSAPIRCMRGRCHAAAAYPTAQDIFSWRRRNM